MIKIKNCPFCGAQPNVYRVTNKWAVYSLCNESCFVFMIGKTKLKAIELWNDRFERKNETTRIPK